MTDKQTAVMYCYKKLGKSRKEIAQFFGVTHSDISRTIRESNIPQNMDVLPETTIDTLNISKRAKNSLKRNGVKSLEQLADIIKSEPEFWCQRYIGFGKCSRKEVEERMKYLGYIKEF